MRMTRETTGGDTRKRTGNSSLGKGRWDTEREGERAGEQGTVDWQYNGTGKNIVCPVLCHIKNTSILMAVVYFQLLWTTAAVYITFFTHHLIILQINYTLQFSHWNRLVISFFQFSWLSWVFFVLFFHFFEQVNSRQSQFKFGSLLNSVWKHWMVNMNQFY